MESASTVTLTELLHMMRKHLTLLLAVSLAFAIGAAGYSFLFMPNEYTSTGSVLASSNTASVKSFFDSKKIRDQALSDAGISNTQKYSITTAIPTSTTTITVTVKGPDAQKCADLAYSLITEGSKKANATLGSNIVKTIDNPVAPDKPTGPKRMSIIVISFLVGFLIACCVIFIRETSGTRKQTASHLENLLHIPVLAEFSADQLVTRIAKHEILPKKNNQRGGSPASRVLFNSIRVASLDEPLRTISVLAIVPDRRSSAIALGLAAVAGAASKSCLLIDATSGASSYEFLPRDQKVDGLYSVVSRRKQLGAVVVSTPYKDLEFLGLEPVANPGSIFASNRFTEVVSTEVKNAYRYIVFDAPSLTPIPDALHISKVCDATIIVVGRDLTDDGLLVQAVEDLREKEANILGLVIAD